MSEITKITLSEMNEDEEFYRAVMAESAEDNVCESCPIRDIDSNRKSTAIFVAVREEDQAVKNMECNPEGYRFSDTDTLEAVKGCLEIRRRNDCTKTQINYGPTLQEDNWSDSELEEEDQFTISGQLAVDLGLE